MLYKKFFYIFLTFFIYCSNNFAEYIIVSDNGQTIQAPPQEIYDQIYNTLLSYQFPVCTWHNNQAFNQLSEQEKNELLLNEQVFIEQKLKNIDPKLRLIFIPTIIYEWFFYINYQTDLNLQNIFWQSEFGDKSAISNKFLVTELEEQKRHENYNDNFDNFKKPDFHNYFDTIEYPVNKESLIIYAHQHMNSLIIENFKNFISASEPCINMGACKKIFNQLSTESLYGDIRVTEDFKNIINNIISIEFEAIQKNAFVLYRSTNGYENYLDKIVKGDTKKFLPSSSYLSYGNTFLAGILFDKTATAAALTFDHNLCYALFINKKDYLKSNSIQNKFFWIPPLMTLAGLYGDGEYFHIRTCFFDQRDSNNLKYEFDFQDFLVQNAQIIKNKSAWSNDILLNTNIIEKNGLSSIHLAVLENNIERFKELLAEPTNIATINNLGQTPLHLAIYYKKMEFIEELLAHNANLQVPDKFGITPLLLAKKEWNREPLTDNLQILANKLQNFPHTHKFFRQIALECELENAMLTRAPLDNEIEEINDEVLFENYLTEQSQIFWNRYSTIIQEINPDLYTKLNPYIGLNTIDFSEIKKYIINLPVDGNYGRTLLFSAISLINIEMSLNREASVHTIEMLLNRGASVHTKDIYENTPLHVTGTVESLRLLLINNNADINVVNIDGDSPLHLATAFENKECLIELLNQGANIEAKNSEGETPLHLAVKNRSNECVRILLEHGANSNAIDNYGRNPLDVVKQINNTAMIEMLEEHLNAQQN
ncbi:ankyrin repeat domain-containing protein [Candidatus Babeliales bacterium]|nr:ankyrin repeat domain-containing protein [Candidatus Babeliales bacterium]